MGGELDLLVAPFGGPVLAGDQAHAVEAAEVPVDKGVAGLGLVGGAVGEGQMPLGVLLPGMRPRAGRPRGARVRRPSSANGLAAVVLGQATPHAVPLAGGERVECARHPDGTTRTDGLGCRLPVTPGGRPLAIRRKEQ
jgi:hypothetical protein